MAFTDRDILALIAAAWADGVTPVVAAEDCPRSPFLDFDHLGVIAGAWPDGSPVVAVDDATAFEDQDHPGLIVGVWPDGLPVVAVDWCPTGGVPCLTCGTKVIDGQTFFEVTEICPGDCLTTASGQLFTTATVAIDPSGGACATCYNGSYPLTLTPLSGGRQYGAAIGGSGGCPAGGVGYLTADCDGCPDPGHDLCEVLVFRFSVFDPVTGCGMDILVSSTVQTCTPRTAVVTGTLRVLGAGPFCPAVFPCDGVPVTVTFS
jgi:hypothetical protein